VSFLNQLKSQANALQSQQGVQQRDLEENIARTESVCRLALNYLQDLARHLNVIQPAGPRFSLDGRTWWPEMKLMDFRVDARKKLLRSEEVFHHFGMGWRIVPQVGTAAGGTVRVNFPTELQRVESRLAMGPVKHERKELRHPEKNTLQAIQFDYLTETRGSVHVEAQHEQALLSFRLLNASGFGILKASFPAAQMNTDLLDEMAKLLVSQPNRFA
jgi:hypothetical protein